MILKFRCSTETYKKNMSELFKKSEEKYDFRNEWMIYDNCKNVNYIDNPHQFKNYIDYKKFIRFNVRFQTLGV